MILDFLQNLTAQILLVLKDMAILVFLIVFAIGFFIAQYYLIKGYVIIFKFISNLPVINQTIARIKLNLDSKFNKNSLKKQE